MLTPLRPSMFRGGMLNRPNILREEVNSVAFEFDEQTASEVGSNILFAIERQRSKPENERKTDYKEYCEIAWKRIIGREDYKSPDYLHFENSVISGILNTDFKEYLFPEAVEAMVDFLSARGEKFSEIVLWSQGDVQKTGIQRVKIYRSEILKNISRMLVETQGADQAKKLRKKFVMLVEDDKFESLKAHLTESQPGKSPLGLVVLEDRTKNIDDLSKISQAEIKPIWCAYARRGKKLQEQDPQAYQKALADYNGIESLKELNSSKIQALVEQGDILLVDFDGVLMDNNRTPKIKGEVFTRHIAQQLEKAGYTPEQIKQKLISFSEQQ